MLLKKPNVYGSIFRFEGQASVFAPHLGGPCYRCLYPEPPPPGMVPSCAEGGVLGVGLIWFRDDVKLASLVWILCYGLALLSTAHFSVSGMPVTRSRKYKIMAGA